MRLRLLVRDSWRLRIIRWTIQNDVKQQICGGNELIVRPYLYDALREDDPTTYRVKRPRPVVIVG